MRPLTFVSTRRKLERPPAEKMDVKMENGLPAVGVSVYHDAVAVVRDAAPPGDLCRGRKQMAEQSLVLFAGLVERIDMLARHHEDVNGSMRTQVVERNALPVLEKLFGRQFAADDLAKDAF